MNRSRYPLLVLAPYLGRYRGRLLVGSFMVLLTVIAGMCAPWALKYVVDGLQQSVDGSRLFSYALLIVAISLVEGFFRFWMRRILIGVSRQVEYDLRNDFLAHVQKMSLSFLQSRSTGDIMSRATNDLGAVRMVLGPGIMYSMNTVTLLVISTAILVNLNWKLTLLAYVPLALVSISVKQFGRRIHDRFEEIQEQFSALSTRTQENIAGIRVVKAFARENSEIRAFGILNLEYVRRNVSLIRLWGVFYPLMTALIGLSSVALLWFGGRQVIQGRLTLGEFVAFMGYLSLLAWPTIAIGRVINIFQRGSASMRRILEILETPPGIRDLEGAEEPPDAGGALEIRNLTFSYPSSPQPALSDVSLSVPPGKTLAIVGRTGSGKSTLANLIPRLYDPPPGTVFVDGRDVRGWPLRSLRRRIGYVPQETFLFSDTIAENIAFGLESKAGEEDILSAARVSRVAGDIESFTQGMQTFVGERGVTLSGGQKQRMAISRAVIGSPDILIFDDSLSSVDTYTEEKILRELGKVMENRTTLLVSHRISTVQRADEIVVLEEGRVVERGTHGELLRRGGAYADLYHKQQLEDELSEI
jgi:ATP-binding cassette subfamily B multidrug efflux pump